MTNWKCTANLHVVLALPAPHTAAVVSERADDEIRHKIEILRTNLQISLPPTPLIKA
jgi:predicted NAD/FAD-dependent oxidoreductase